jgi:ABC-type multidrug transport system ATPase subunit
MPAVEWISVSKRYGARAALAEVSFALPEGASLGLLGPNGAGKTTALRLALGHSRPDAGRVRLNGLSPEEPASRIGVGWLPERLALPARSRVRAFLRLHARLAGLEPGRVDDEVDGVLAATGLGERADDPLGSLSKGLAQRLGFAQALLGAPRVLLLDEPTSGLDPLGVRDAREWIVAAHRRGASVLVASHVLSEIERTCDHVVILHAGRIAAGGRLDEVVREGESLEDAFVRLVGRGDAAA